MSSHGTVVDHRSGLGVRLRELDDSRRGARFSNRKEDKLLERKLTYLNNQVKDTVNNSLGSIIDIIYRN